MTEPRVLSLAETPPDIPLGLLSSVKSAELKDPSPSTIEFMRAERERLEQFVREQFDALRKSREELEAEIARHQEAENALGRRQQELDRQAQLLETRRQQLEEQLRNRSEDAIGDSNSKDWVSNAPTSLADQVANLVVESSSLEIDQVRARLGAFKNKMVLLEAERDAAWEELYRLRGASHQLEQLRAERDSARAQRDAAFEQLRLAALDAQDWAVLEAELATQRRYLKEDFQQLRELAQDLRQQELTFKQMREAERQALFAGNPGLQPNQEIAAKRKSLEELQQQLENQTRELRLQEAEIVEMRAAAKEANDRDWEALAQERVRLVRLRESLRLEQEKLAVQLTGTDPIQAG
jgi:hypothetical protein